MDANQICGLLDASLVNLIHNVVVLIKIAVPIVLVIFGMLDFMKGVIASKEDEIKKGQNVFIKRLIAGVLVFFVVTIVQLLMNFIAKDDDGVWACANQILNGNTSSTSNDYIYDCHIPQMEEEYKYCISKSGEDVCNSIFQSACNVKSSSLLWKYSSSNNMDLVSEYSCKGKSDVSSISDIYKRGLYSCSVNGDRSLDECASMLSNFCKVGSGNEQGNSGQNNGQSNNESGIVLIDGDGTNVGDEVAINTEHFYVVSSNESETVLLAKYNLYVGSVYGIQGNHINDISKDDPNYLLQNEKARGYISDTSIRVGTLAFSNEAYWFNSDGSFKSTYEKYTIWASANENGRVYSVHYIYDSSSNLFSYVEQYKDKIQNFGVHVKQARILDFLEARILETDESQRGKLYLTEFWINGGYLRVSGVRRVLSCGGNQCFGLYYNEKTSAGVRPVIVVNTSDIKG